MHTNVLKLLKVEFTTVINSAFASGATMVSSTLILISLTF